MLPSGDVNLRLVQLFTRKLENTRASMGVLPDGGAFRLHDMHHLYFLPGQVSGRD